MESTNQLKEIKKKNLINKLNYINFHDGTVTVNLKNTTDNRPISRHVKPQPCHGNRLDCIWEQPAEINQILNAYKFESLIINDGQNRIIVKSDLINLNDKGISLILPATCHEINARALPRHFCKNIKAQVLQNGIIFNGALIDFNGICFRVELNAIPPQTFQWINSELPANIHLTNGNGTLYSGKCKIHDDAARKLKTGSYLLEASNQQIQRFTPKEFRSMRQELVPSPDIIFKHPLTDKIITIKVADLSGCGFSVIDNFNNINLLPGLIIPQLKLSFANNFSIECKAQVIYRKKIKPQKGRNLLKCGLAILDIGADDHTRLLALLQQANNKNIYICNPIDTNLLWDFFFETGFIYPEKYEYFQEHKEKIKKTYEKLYNHNPSIAKHFIYLDRGIILGHMAMLRFYENTWLIHHHAAKRDSTFKAGLTVLDQIGRFTFESCRFYSSHMNFLICYFRPQNKFPNKVFGEAHKHIKNPKICSLDKFAYFHYQKNSSMTLEDFMSGPWVLNKAQSEDLMELENYYERESGGIMIHALDLTPDSVNNDKLSEEYKRLGFKKKRSLYALKKNGSLAAILMVNVADTGLNMSDLTNCIKVFVLNTTDLPWDTLDLTLSLLVKNFEQNEMPVLLYPYIYADYHSIPYDKLYNLWAMNCKYSDEYFRFFKKLLKA